MEAFWAGRILAPERPIAAVIVTGWGWVKQRRKQGLLKARCRITLPFPALLHRFSWHSLVYFSDRQCLVCSCKYILLQVGAIRKTRHSVRSRDSQSLDFPIVGNNILSEVCLSKVKASCSMRKVLSDIDFCILSSDLLYVRLYDGP